MSENYELDEPPVCTEQDKIEIKKAQKRLSKLKGFYICVLYDPYTEILVKEGQNKIDTIKRFFRRHKSLMQARMEEELHKYHNINIFIK